MISRFRLTRQILPWVFAALLLATPSVFAAETVKIGVLALRGPEHCLAQWSPTADYLSQAIPGKKFDIVPLSFEEISPAVKTGSLDFILAESDIYVELEITSGVSRIATLKNKVLNQTLTTYGGVIFCRKDRTDIRTLQDIVGKRFMAAGKNSFGGWIAAWREFKEAGIDPFSDFASLTFGDAHDQVVEAVLNHEADAGTVRTHVLENMAADGKIRLDDFNIIHGVGEGKTGFPFLLSTREYPEWPMGKLEHTPTPLAEAVAVALIGMKEDSAAAHTAACSGWTIPLSYLSVHDCLQYLKIGPYATSGKITLWEVIQKYRGPILLLLILFAVMGLSIAGFFRLNRSLRIQQEALGKSEEKYRLLITHALSGMATNELLLDASGAPVDYIYLDANPAFEVQTGLAVSSVRGRRATEVFPGDDTAPLIDIYGKVILSGKPAAFEQYFAPLGRHFHITAYGIGGNRFATIFTDITDRKQMEEKVREVQVRLQGITDSSPDAILMMDPQGNVSFWNPAAETILGYRREEVLGRNLHELLAPEQYLEKHQAAYPAFLKDGCGNAIGRTVELSARRKDGKEIVIALSLSGVALSDGWHAVGIIRNITPQKKVLEDLSQTNQELEAAIARANEMTVQAEIANIAKSEFLANMSHEIRTPMNGVIGMTGLLLDTPLTDEQRRFAETVRASGESLLSLINDILDFSKIEAKKLDLEILDFDLQSLLDDFTISLAFQAQDKGLELLCALDPTTPALLRGDPGRLRQILTNLTGNAIKFTREGEVAVRVTLVSETEADALLRFSVRDTGIGIPKNKIGRLFEKFSQVDASTTRQFGGTGLGLAISKELAGLMGGEIGVLSQPGKGSEFWFTARLWKQPENARREADAPADLTGLRVLIVDDSATNREILAAQTSAWGMRPTLAESGPSGLAALEETLLNEDPFQVVIVDMQMPGMDGETFGRTVLADERLKSLPLILLTSMGTRGDSHRYADIGFSAYLTKPARARELRSVMALALSNQDGLTSPGAILTRHSARETSLYFGHRKARILLAEDNMTNQQVALGILKKFGLSADAVANGIEVLKTLESIPYDLILMDVQMPEMDGFEATRRIRDPHSKVLNHVIPIIAMTAHAMSGDQERCLNAGMNGYVPKPVSPTALAKALEQWLPQQAPPGEGTNKSRVSVQPDSGESQIAWNKGALLERLMEDEDLMKTIVEGFIEDIPVQIQTLRDLLEKKDFPEAGRLAHRIKGAAANMGGESLQETAARMEDAARGDALGEMTALMAELEDAFQTMHREMLAFMTRKNG